RRRPHAAPSPRPQPSPSLGSPEASRPLHAAPPPCTHAEDGRSTRHGDDAPSRAVHHFSISHSLSALFSPLSSRSTRSRPPSPPSLSGSSKPSRVRPEARPWPLLGLIVPHWL